MTTPRDQELRVPIRRRKRILACFAWVAAAGLMGFLAQSEIVLVTGEQNGELAVPSYVFKEDDFENPRLRLLRSRESLDRIVSPAKSQFETILMLRAWAHMQWVAGGSFYYPPWDAVEILDLARKHGNRGVCAQYAIVF